MVITFTDRDRLAPLRTGASSPRGVPDADTGPEVDFELTLRNGSRERVTGADAYQQEQSMTTFFRTDGRRGVDCWSVRMASFRTDEILAIRRLPAGAVGPVPGAGTTTD